jgi:hypothetical protein
VSNTGLSIHRIGPIMERPSWEVSTVIAPSAAQPISPEVKMLRVLQSKHRPLLAHSKRLLLLQQHFLLELQLRQHWLQLPAQIRACTTLAATTGGSRSCLDPKEVELLCLPLGLLLDLALKLLQLSVEPSGSLLPSCVLPGYSPVKMMLICC